MPPGTMRRTLASRSGGVKRPKRSFAYVAACLSLVLLSAFVLSAVSCYKVLRLTPPQVVDDEATHQPPSLLESASLQTSDLPTEVPPAYVISLVKCGSNPVGFLDAAVVFLQSVHANSKETPGSGGRYGYAAYAIVHKNCEEHAPLLERVGYKVLVKDTPFQRNEIRGPELRKSIESALCCGSAEYIKLYAYTLVEHPVVLHFDLDCAILQPLDHLFDAMLYPSHHPRGKAARATIAYERKNEPIPDQIDAFLTMDYPTSWPWKEEAPMQGGWLVIRPSQEAFDEYIEIVKEGNYTGGFNNEAGWGSLGYGGWIGGAAIQGIVAYFYGHFHSNTYVELDICQYNQIGANVFWERGEHRGKCKKYARNPGEEYDCSDCRITDMSLVKSVHYCGCKKPWSCPIARTKTKERHRIDSLNGFVNITTCNAMHKKWFELRRDYEDRMVQLTGDTSVIATRRGTFHPEIFLDYCNGEGDYIPIAFPEQMRLK